MNVRLSTPTTCHRCRGWLAEGEKVTVEWDEETDGYIHRHTRRALCKHAAKEEYEYKQKMGNAIT